MTSERPFDPGLDTPTDYQPGTGRPVPGSPVDRDAQIREESDARLAQIAETESQRVAADQEPRRETGRREETNSGTSTRRSK